MADQLSSLLDLLRTRCTRWGAFTLSSGRTSDLYIDARLATLHAEGSLWVAQAFLERLHPEVVAVGGLTLGADPIACGVATLAALRGRPTHAFLVRKAPKGHGAGRLIEGLDNLPAGAAVAIVEDTTTTGGSLLEAARRAAEAGLVVKQTLTLIDREEGAAEALAEAGFTLEAVFRRRDLVAS